MEYRNLFDGIEATVQLNDGRRTIPINLDNGATTPPLKEITDQMKNWIKYYGPIGRGTGQKGDWSSNAYELAKEYILKFFNAYTNPNYSVVYTKSATEGINILANALIRKKADEVLVTRMEHHANDLPWRVKATVKYVDIDKQGRISVEEIERLLYESKGRIKYVTVTGASNVTGYMNPIYRIASICHQYGAKIIVDAAQLVAHQSIHMLGKRKDDYIDFLVFSGHKMYAPFGSGGIVGNFVGLDHPMPIMWGGGMVESVGDYSAKVEDVPKIFEGGTQNLIGILAMHTAMKKLSEVGFEKIMAHEKKLKNYLVQELRGINRVIMYGDVDNTSDRLGVITFNIKERTYIDVATMLAERYGIATRCGKFCAHPYVDRLLALKNSTHGEVPSYYGEYGMVRISLGLYNTKEEIDDFLNAVNYICTVL